MDIASLIPSSNVLSLPSFRGKALKASTLEAAYGTDGGFVGAFLDRDGQPDWARKIAAYHRDEFRTGSPGRVKRFGDVKMAAAGEGECFVSCRHALELWEAGGRAGLKPFAREQDYGSCVGMSWAEHMTSIFGWRAARPEFGEVFKVPCSCYPYSGRGYCSDGWDGWSCMTVSRKFGAAFQMPYELAGGKVDLTGDDGDEQMMARTWCRSGPPQWFVTISQTGHPFEDGAITEFDGDLAGLRTLLAAGGALQTGGTTTSGGPKPFTYGPVGPHMQSVIGGDDSDQFRKFCVDTLGIKARESDFPCVFSQTWGPGWRGECADQYWPAWWGPKPEGAWLMWASDVLRHFRGDMFAYLPRVKGFAGATPPQPPASQHPPIAGELYVDGTAIRGTLVLSLPNGEFRYIAAPAGGERYKLVPKPNL